jgi:hypothetical protein
VRPKLDRFAALVSDTLVDDEGYGPARATLVELTYVNLVRPAEGVWANHDQLHRVLRLVSDKAGDEPYGVAERVSLRFSFPLYEADTGFVGRLHVAAEPAYTPEGVPVLHLNLISRRIVETTGSGAEEVFDACHRDIVCGFVAITTTEMHTIWERFK